MVRISDSMYVIITPELLSEMQKVGADVCRRYTTRVQA